MQPGTYKIVADFEHMVVTILNVSTGLDAIDADNFDLNPVYYNLQGVRVDNPSAGLYIVRRGNAITKEIVR